MKQKLECGGTSSSCIFHMNEESQLLFFSSFTEARNWFRFRNVFWTCAKIKRCVMMSAHSQEEEEGEEEEEEERCTDMI